MILTTEIMRILRFLELCIEQEDLKGESVVLAILPYKVWRFVIAAPDFFVSKPTKQFH